MIGQFIDVVVDVSNAIISNFFPILVIVLIVSLVYYFIASRNAVKLTHDTLIIFTGVPGGGKTFNAVKEGIRTYKRYLLRYKLKRFFFPFKNHSKDKPFLYSNVPIKYKKIFSYEIEIDHLLFKLQFNGRPVIIFDEIGDVASQNDYDNEYVVELLAGKVVRFIRHTTNGRLILTDQMSSSIYKGIRGRAGKVYSVSNFRKRFLFFVKMDCVVYQQSEDNLQNVNIVNDKSTPYLFKYIGKTFKYYDSRAYSILYDDVPVKSDPPRHKAFKTKQYLKMPYKRLMSKRKGE